MSTNLVIILLIVLRVAVPIAIIALLSFIAHRLDKRWQEKAANAPKEIIDEASVSEANYQYHI